MVPNITNRKLLRLFLGYGIFGILLTLSLFLLHPSLLGFFKPYHVVQFKMKSTGARIINFQAEVEYWKKRISAVGGKPALTELAHSVQGMNVSMQHTVAHTFGEALYQVEGVAGLSVCGSEYSQGCFHQFFGSAMHDQGMEKMLPEVGKLCGTQVKITDKRNCEHGVGHGILGYLGYAEKDVVPALAACRKALPETDLVLGCFGGVFMEYNVQALLRADDAEARPLSDTSKYGPCDILFGKDKISCVFWEPWWWHLTLKKDHDVTTEAQLLGQYCTGLSATALRSACFKGLGYMAPNTEKYDAGEMVRFCKAASNVARERISCWLYASSQIGPYDTVYDNEICEGLDGDELPYCLLHSHDTFSIFTRGDLTLP